MRLKKDNQVTKESEPVTTLGLNLSLDKMETWEKFTYVGGAIPVRHFEQKEGATPSLTIHLPWVVTARKHSELV